MQTAGLGVFQIKPEQKIFTQSEKFINLMYMYSGAEKIAQQLGVLDALEDPGLDPSPHIGWLTTTCNYSSKGFDTTSWFPRATNSHRHLHIHIKINLEIHAPYKPNVHSISITKISSAFTILAFDTLQGVSYWKAIDDSFCSTVYCSEDRNPGLFPLILGPDIKITRLKRKCPFIKHLL